MGQQHDKAGLTHPFGLSRGDELIDDALGSVVEVSKLSLPADQGVGVGHGVTQLKSCKAIQLDACFLFWQERALPRTPNSDRELLETV
jgi:hypothetical protein